jgi:hypothetical protein
MERQFASELVLDNPESMGAPVSFSGQWKIITDGLKEQLSQEFNLHEAEQDLASNDITAVIDAVDTDSESAGRVDSLEESKSRPYGRHALLEDEASPVVYVGRHRAEGGRHRLEEPAPAEVLAPQPKTTLIELARSKRKQLVAAALAATAVTMTIFVPQSTTSHKPYETARAVVEAPAPSPKSSSLSWLALKHSVDNPTVQASPIHIPKPAESPAAAATPESAPVPQASNNPEAKGNSTAADIAPGASNGVEPAAPETPPPITEAPKPAPAAAPERQPEFKSPVCDPEVKYAYQNLLGQGLSPEAVAGVIGNAMKEDPGLDPAIVQGGGTAASPRPGVGYGTFQFTTKSRQDGLIEFAKTEPAPDNKPSSLKAQLDYAVLELKTNFKDTWDKLTSKTSGGDQGHSKAYMLAVAFMQGYERPKDHASDGRNAHDRGASADKVLADMPKCNP